MSAEDFRQAVFVVLGMSIVICALAMKSWQKRERRRRDEARNNF
jgi:hypothetical protein